MSDFWTFDENIDIDDDDDEVHECVSMHCDCDYDIPRLEGYNLMQSVSQLRCSLSSWLESVQVHSMPAQVCIKGAT